MGCCCFTVCHSLVLWPFDGLLLFRCYCLGLFGCLVGFWFIFTAWGGGGGWPGRFRGPGRGGARRLGGLDLAGLPAVELGGLGRRGRMSLCFFPIFRLGKSSETETPRFFFFAGFWFFLLLLWGGGDSEIRRSGFVRFHQRFGETGNPFSGPGSFEFGNSEFQIGLCWESLNRIGVQGFLLVGIWGANCQFLGPSEIVPRLRSVWKEGCSQQDRGYLQERRSKLPCSSA